jgi:hypothetical protein
MAQTQEQMSTADKRAYEKLLESAGPAQTPAPAQPQSPSPVTQPPLPAFKEHVWAKGERAILKQASPACQDYADWDKVLRLVIENDRAAVDKMIDRGQCMVLQQGAELIVVEARTGDPHLGDATRVYQNVCVRWIGNPDCLWTGGLQIKSTD